jgi:hypothetical protein
MGIFKGLIEGGLKGLGETAKGIIQQVGENKLGVAEAALAIEKEANRASETITAQANDLEKTYLADVGNSRDMQKAALAQSDIFSKRYVYYFSTFWSLFSAGYLIGITFIEIPDKNIRVVDTVLGFLLGTAIAAMFSWFYGSSMNSKTRNDQVYGAITDKLKEKH